MVLLHICYTFKINQENVQYLFLQKSVACNEENIAEFDQILSLKALTYDVNHENLHENEDGNRKSFFFSYQLKNLKISLARTSHD